MSRQLQPELLDSLPPDHPDARHSRRDLRLINAIMGNQRWLARSLARLLPPTGRALEIGAGTGELGRRLVTAGLAVDGLDFAPRPPDWPPAHEWHTTDLLRFGGYDRYYAVVGNLIFHHFADKELATLGQTLGRSVRAIVACEPGRNKASQRLFAAVAPLFRANHVTLHDAHVSIAAGFRADELPHLLGLDPAEWNWQCDSTLRGAYHMVAIRRTRA